MSFKARVLLLSLVALLLMGSVSTGAAYAEAGPFLGERESAKSEEQEIPEMEPVAVQGEGGEQVLKGSIGKEKATEIEIVAKEVQIKGIVYNNALQGQAKLELTFHNPKLIKPKTESCEPKIGENNTVKLFGHLAWKWNGLKKQLEEEAPTSQNPDWIFLSSELEKGATGLPKGVLTTITIPVLGCGVLGGTKASVEGSLVGEAKPGNEGEWSSSEEVTTPEGKKSQHFWNGKEFVGVETGLLFSGNPASLVGGTKIKATAGELELLLGPYYFHAAVYPATIEAPAVGNHKFKAAGEAIECATVNFTSSMPGPGSQATLTLTPTYAGCGLYTVTPNTCTWVVGPAFEAPIMPAGCEMKITKGTCEIKIPSQTDLQSVSLDFGNKAGEIEMKMRVTLIKYTAANCTSGSGANGRYEGIMKAKGKTNVNQPDPLSRGLR